MNYVMLALQRPRDSKAFKRQYDRQREVSEEGKSGGQQRRRVSLLLRGIQAFREAYKREFGFVLEGRELIVDDVRVRATGKVRCALPRPL